MKSIYLPSEIILTVVRNVAAETDPHCRLGALYACCLVSRQWYSVSVSYLYEFPEFETGISFQEFATTICPPVGVKKSKENLGSFVRRLNLGGLVHESSNSLTARLIGRVKDNLEVFIAPRVSFA